MSLSRLCIGLCNVTKSSFSISSFINNNIGTTATCGFKTWTQQIENTKPTFNYLRLNEVQWAQIRNSHFYSNISAKALWRSVTSVSNAGRKRGRARANRRNYAKDLNKGQQIGVGVNNFAWVGLSSPVVMQNKLNESHPLPKDEEREQKLVDIRNRMGKPRKFRESNLVKGFSGGTLKGKRFGPPDPFEDCNFDGFESVLLQSTRMLRMSGLYGRVYTVRVCVAIGNHDGVIGYAECEAPRIMEAIRKGKNLAARNLFGVNRHGDTIPSSFSSQVHCSKVFVEPRLPGRGLSGKDSIQAICQLAGIKDLRVKSSGARHNKPNTIKAFIQGLVKMRTLQELADEKKLKIVDFSGNYPKLMAEPSKEIRKHSDIKEDEELDVNLYTLKTSMIVPRKTFRPIFSRSSGHYIHLKEMEHVRYNYRKRLRLWIEHGEIKSFLTEKYKEAIPNDKKFEKVFRRKQEEITNKGEIPEKDLHDFHIPRLSQKSRFIDVY